MYYRLSDTFDIFQERQTLIKYYKHHFFFHLSYCYLTLYLVKFIKLDNCTQFNVVTWYLLMFFEIRVNAILLLLYIII